MSVFSIKKWVQRTGLLALVGCAGSSVVEVGENLLPFQEQISDEFLTPVVIDDFRCVLESDSQVSVYEEPLAGFERLSFETLGLLDGAAWTDGYGLVATSDGLLVLDRELLESPLDAGLPGPVLGMNVHGEDLWLTFKDKTLQWRDGQLTQVYLDGLPVRGRVAGAQEAGEAWVIRRGVHRVSIEGSTAQIIETAPVVNGNLVGVSRGNRVWVVGGDALGIMEDQTWTRWLLPSPVKKIWSHPDAEPVWMESDAGLYVWHRGTYRPVDTAGEDITVHDVDPSGRLWVDVKGTLERWGVERTVLIKGLKRDARLEVSQTIQVVPSFAKDVASVELAINGEEWLSASGIWELDPIEIGDGAHELSAQVEYADPGESVSIIIPFSVGNFEIPTWKDDIRPVSEAECGVCHDGDSETVLNTIETWQGNIDQIVELVSKDAMPLGRPPLRSEEKALLRAWRAGGMQP